MSYDAELRRHNEVLRRAVGVRLHDYVLDIGCGAGLTTRQAARAARAGGAHGVDISAPAITRARELARAEGLGNVTFEHADAQLHRFPPERFDLAISRFGTMFFDDPVAAFANIGRALRPAGRLVMMVWQAGERNEWDVAIHQALDAADGPVAGACGGPDPFSLADPSTVKEILHAAGFAGVAFTDVHELVYYGPDVAAALDWVRGFTCTSNVPPACTESGDRRPRMRASGWPNEAAKSPTTHVLPRITAPDLAPSVCRQCDALTEHRSRVCALTGRTMVDCPGFRACTDVRGRSSVTLPP